MTGVAIIGAGAAGLATAIFARRANPQLQVALIDGARQPGAKILVSGGSRCNVTNRIVTEADFNGGRPAIIRKVLRAFQVPATAAFFHDIGVSLHEEPGGKLFPDTNRSRDVLDALMHEATRLGVDCRFGQRVVEITREREMFHVATSEGSLTAHALVLATGGRSLPKTGSDGWGYGVAERFGHTIVPTTPALVPLLLDRATDQAADAGTAVHVALSGVAQPVRLSLGVDGAITVRVEGAMLWTHFGISGPAALDASRHWLRARLEGRRVELTASLRPDDRFESLEEPWIALTRARPRQSVHTTLAGLVPASVATAILGRLALPEQQMLAEFPRDQRRALIHALLAWPLPVVDSRGYNYAEVTAGGVALDEINPASMESRRCPGLFLVGEILDVDGRIGGFNFQWAWSSARAAGQALGVRIPAP